MYRQIITFGDGGVFVDDGIDAVGTAQLHQSHPLWAQGQVGDFEADGFGPQRQ
ncbi:MAG: hypothetical protein RLZZ123_1906, partial [Pseudomonadota bacterium]